jgi:hypothetical protein
MIIITDDPDQLRKAVEQMHQCLAQLAQSVPVKETHEGATVWEGVVHVFDLTGHPTASRGYAWSSPIEGSDKRRFFAVLHQGPIKSPADAVRAAIVAARPVFWCCLSKVTPMLGVTRMSGVRGSPLGGRRNLRTCRMTRGHFQR